MEAVVREELRGRGDYGRDLVELEDAVEAFKDLDVQQRAWEEACSRAAKQVASNACRSVCMSARRSGKQRAGSSNDPPEAAMDAAIAEAVADPNVEPGYYTALLMQQAEARRAARSVQSRAFLARPYHEFGCNRFLFSCADEPESCAQNLGTAWKYSLPE